MAKSVSRMTKNKLRILFVLHLPPPVHGAALVGSAIRESRLVNDTFETKYFNLSSSVALEQVGHFSLRKFRRVFRLIREVRHTISEWKPDRVYLTPSSTMPGLLKDALVVHAIRSKGVRVILHLHNKGVSERQDRFVYDRLYRILFRNAHVILLSERLYPDIRKYVPEERVSYCPNGVFVPERDFSTPLGMAEVVPRILFLSNIIRSKGVTVLIKACRLLKERGVDYRCSLVGVLSADYAGDSLADEIRRQGVDERVTYDGPAYGEDKWAAFSKADIFVHPTLDDAFPLVIPEAMGTGLPVVTTEEGGIPDMVRDGVDGLICPKGNPAALADALGKLLADAGLRTRMGESGRARYRELFTRERFEKRLVDILKDA